MTAEQVERRMRMGTRSEWCTIAASHGPHVSEQAGSVVECGGVGAKRRLPAIRTRLPATHALFDCPCPRCTGGVTFQRNPSVSWSVSLTLQLSQEMR